jgi:tetratricopeptide (TPR) repeat protein
VKPSLWRRWTNRRALTALGIFALAASAIFALTRKDDDAPYRPGEERSDVTDVNRRSAEGIDWGITWQDAAAASGIGFRHFAGGTRSTQLPEDMGSGCAFADYDRDGDWDLFVADVAGPLTMTSAELRRAPGGSRLYRNDGGVFTDVTEESGLGGLKGNDLGAVWGDFDNDGFADLVLTSFGALHLFHNRGDGSFEDVTGTSGLAGRRGFWTGATWGDFDGDGRLDLYVCGYVDYRLAPGDLGRRSKFGSIDSPFTINPSSYPPVKNLLFHNEGAGRFRELAEEAGVADPEGRSLSATFADFDNDGKPDLYVANDVSEGALYVNRGNGLFADRGRDAHVADYRGAMGIAVADVNGDGALDMFVTHWIAEANALYVNKLLSGPSPRLDFEDAAERFGLGEVSTDDIAWGTAFLDVDGDGKPDLVVANGSTFEDTADPTRLRPMPMRLFRNLGAKGFVDVAPLSGGPLSIPRVHRGLAIADVDGDLREEIAVVVHGGNLVLLKANGGPPNHRIAIRCEGVRSNRSAFGTRLTLESEGRRQIREIGAGSSYLSQNAPEAIFGLGTSRAAQHLTVRWPSGLVQTFRDLPADRAYRLLEGSPQPVEIPDTRARTIAFWKAYEHARAATGAGNNAEATAAYREALALNPRHEDSLYALGNLCLDAGDAKEARDLFERLLTISPRSGRAHGALGDLFAGGDPPNLSRARHQYALAGAHNAEETGWVVRVAEIELAEHDFGAAGQALQKVLATNPRSFPALYFSGYLLWRAGNQRAARRLFDSALAALAPPAGPAPGEGDLKKRASSLPRRGAFARHWAFLAGAPQTMEIAYRDLDRALSDIPSHPAASRPPKTVGDSPG